MLLLLISIPVILYTLFSIFAVRYVWKKTNRILYRSIAVGIVILFPSWDALLASALFHVAGPFVGESKIYEVAHTDGIYYEDTYRNVVIISQDSMSNEFKVISYTDEDLRRGYRFVESLVTIVQDSYQGKKNAVSPTVYRCTKRIKPNLPRQVFENCEPAKDISSGYLVRTETKIYGLLEIDSLIIYNRTTGSVMAEYRGITKKPFIGVPFPFFTWLNWDSGEWRSGESVSYPPRELFWSFQYEVLKVIKSVEGDHGA